MQPLINYIERFVKLDTDTIWAVENLAEIETFKKNSFILKQGQRCNKIWFLKSGMVRKFYLAEGKEITT
mgnify:FL=1